MSEKSGYLLGLGSNINPFDNFPRIIQQLRRHFDVLHISRVLNIPPIGMNSQQHFLNAVMFIETDFEVSKLKAICNHIEIELGRDRDDPDSKHKDRPADLDILRKVALPEDKSVAPADITDEYFLYPLIKELIAFLTDSPLPTIQQGSLVKAEDLSFGESATTIYRNSHTG